MESREGYDDEPAPGIPADLEPLWDQSGDISLTNCWRRPPGMTERLVIGGPNDDGSTPNGFVADRPRAIGGWGVERGRGMMEPPKFEVLVHEDERYQQKARLVLPVMPYPGLVILHRTGSWEVLRVQLMARDGESLAEKHNDPHMVSVIAKERPVSFFDE